jgi:hypothetical protein
MWHGTASGVDLLDEIQCRSDAVSRETTLTAIAVVIFENSPLFFHRLFH